MKITNIKGMRRKRWEGSHSQPSYSLNHHDVQIVCGYLTKNDSTTVAAIALLTGLDCRSAGAAVIQSCNNNDMISSVNSLIITRLHQQDSRSIYGINISI